MLSHAVEERLKTMIEQLSVISEHRMDVIKVSLILTSLVCIPNAHKTFIYDQDCSKIQVFAVYK